jgi:hypothetical protein
MGANGVEGWRVIMLENRAAVERYKQKNAASFRKRRLVRS